MDRYSETKVDMTTKGVCSLKCSIQAAINRTKLQKCKAWNGNTSHALGTIETAKPRVTNTKMVHSMVRSEPPSNLIIRELKKNPNRAVLAEMTKDNVNTAVVAFNSFNGT